MISSSFWLNKRVFITGHTGFKGSWMSLWLSRLGAQIFGFGLKPTSSYDLFNYLSLEHSIISVFGDIRDTRRLSAALESFDPEIIIHLAAQPLVIKGYDDPLETFSTNIIGTVNLLESARSCRSLKVILNVTTDKVYENYELGIAFREDDRLGGKDPYSASKACSELVTKAYRSSFFSHSGVITLTARAGNVIGGGDWAADRLIPDIIRAVQNQATLRLRSPNSIRPWQHVLESISGYLTYVEFGFKNENNTPTSCNFGPDEGSFMSVKSIVEKAEKTFSTTYFNIVEESLNLFESGVLTINSDLAQKVLLWSPRWAAEEAVEKTFDWYKRFLDKENPLQLTIDQIEDYSR